ncbi:MAG: ABC transporter permease [Acidimicrobiales bacterium]
MKVPDVAVTYKWPTIDFSRLGWAFTLAAAIVLWLIACAISGHLVINLLFDNLILGSFVALVGVGQMVVIASGDGAFDLSIPYVMTLAAFVCAAVSGAQGKNLAVGILAGLGTGLVAGIFNGVLVTGPGLPPIVATLATGYIAYTVVLLMGTQLVVAPSLTRFAQQSWHGLTMVIVVAIVIWTVVALVRGQTPYGLHLHAMGQSRAAAALAAVRVKTMAISTFVISGFLAAIAGILLSGYVGGIYADMATTYLIGSVAAVVVGGTSVRGGESAIAATIFGAITVTLLTTVLELSGAGPGLQDIGEGAVIIIVVTVAAQAQTAR